MKLNKYIVEALGTAVLALTVGLSLKGVFPVSTPVLAGLVLVLFVNTVGHVSGTHLNPAVTVGAFLLKKISSRDAVMYVVAQFIGGIVALVVTNTVYPGAFSFGSTGVPAPSVAFAEILGTAVFTFGIASVVFGKIHDHMQGIIIGGSLVLGIALASFIGSAGLLNPAVALGVGSLNVFYLLAPVVGSALGMLAYKKLCVEEIVVDGQVTR